MLTFNAVPAITALTEAHSSMSTSLLVHINLRLHLEHSMRHVLRERSIVYTHQAV